MLEKLWKLYEEAVWEEVKIRERENNQDESKRGFTMVEGISANGRVNGILRCIEELSEDKKETWRKSFDIWTKAHECTTAYGFWVSVKDRLPNEDGNYLVCFDDEFVASASYIDGDWELWADSGEVIAWMPLPKSYKV